MKNLGSAKETPQCEGVKRRWPTQSNGFEINGALVSNGLLLGTNWVDYQLIAGIVKLFSMSNVVNRCWLHRCFSFELIAHLLQAWYIWWSHECSKQLGLLKSMGFLTSRSIILDLGFGGVSGFETPFDTNIHVCMYSCFHMIYIFSCIYGDLEWSHSTQQKITISLYNFVEDEVCSNWSTHNIEPFGRIDVRMFICFTLKKQYRLGEGVLRMLTHAHT